MELNEIYRGFVLREITNFIVRRDIVVVTSKGGIFDEKLVKEKYGNAILGLKDINYGTVHYAFLSAPNQGLLIVLDLEKQWMTDIEYAKEVLRIALYKALQDHELTYRLSIDIKEPSMQERIWEVYKEMADNLEYQLT